MRVGFIGKNSNEMVDVIIEHWNNGNSIVLVDPNMPLKKAMILLEEIDVKICYIDRCVIPTDIGYNGTIVCRYFLSSYSTSKCLSSIIRNKYCLNESFDEAVVFFSSGTTGINKAISLSHYAITNNAKKVVALSDIGYKDIICNVRLFSYSSAFVAELMVSLLTNAELYFCHSKTVGGILHNLHESHATYFNANPIILKLITRYFSGDIKYPFLKKIYTSGELIDINTIRKIHCLFKNAQVLNGYGFTEAGPRVTTQLFPNYETVDAGSCLPNVKVRIISEQGKVCSTNKIGEILVYTDTKYSGCLSKNGLLNKNSDEWLRSGDLGFFDEQEHLHIIGRKDNVMIFQSHKIIPETVESYICKNSDILYCKLFLKDNKICCDYFPAVRDESLKKLVQEMREEFLFFEIPSQFRFNKNLLNSNMKVSRLNE